MSQFKYQLEPYKGMKSRYTCPRCGSKHNFSRYVDAFGNHFSQEHGRCNSEVSCGYHLIPKGKADSNLIDFVIEYKEPTFLSPRDMQKDGFAKDNLYKFLCTRYRKSEVHEIFRRYKVRSNNERWWNSTVFYQVDLHDRYRTGKIILYDKLTGKRIKKPFSKIYWVHKMIKDREFTLEQCLFGEHLLKGVDTERTIYLVESEKSAIICALNDPSAIFLATGGLSNINPKKMKILRGMDVIALPDKGGYYLWKKKLEPFSIKVSELIENSDLNIGDDIADLILK